MGVKLVLVFYCAVLVSGCRYSKNPGLIRNFLQDGPSNLIDISNRDRDFNPVYGGEVASFSFMNPIDIHDNGNSNSFVKVCDNGILILANDSGSAEDCKTALEIQSLGSTTFTGPVIVADAINETLATLNYTVEAQHIMRSNQINEENQVVGASYCELQIIEGMINDCEELGRRNITVEEAAVVTWRIQHSGDQNYDFQAVIAVTSNNATYVIFLYESSPVIPDYGNDISRGQIFGANSGLSGEERFSGICNALFDRELHLKSNCKCAERGHFVFETTEITTGRHGFCGSESGKDTCESQNSDLDDSMNINRNCRNASMPQDSCDDSYYCELTPDRSMTVAFRNHDADRISFLDYDAYADGADGDSGFANPHGDNIQPIDPSGVGSCSDTISPSNTTFQTFTRSYGNMADARCFKYVAAENAFYFVYMLWRSGDGLFVMADGTRIVSGKCVLDDLEKSLSDTVDAGDIDSTTIPLRTLRDVTLQLWDRRTTVNNQVIESGATVEIGERVFAAICYNKGLDYYDDVDPYGVYAYSFEISNNPEFDTNGENETLRSIGSDGCLTSVPGINSAGRFDDNFEAIPPTNALSDPFCIIAGGLKAFRFPTGEPRLYMRCYVGFCTNTQLFEESKCQDSCEFSTIDADPVDPDEIDSAGDGRKRRDVQDVEELVLVVNVVDPATENKNAKRANCTDPVMAKSVIGALVTLLVIATIVTIAEFMVLQKKRK